MHYGEPPKQVAFDGGFTSQDNLTVLKEDLKVEEVTFSKGKGLAIDDMVKDSFVYKRLRNFRAGVEGIISYLKRGFGLRRCTWHGLRGFKAYVWGSIVSANLLTLARHVLA